MYLRVMRPPWRSPVSASPPLSHDPPSDDAPRPHRFQSRGFRLCGQLPQTDHDACDVDHGQEVASGLLVRGPKAEAVVAGGCAKLATLFSDSGVLAMKARIQWAGDAMFLGESGRGARKSTCLNSSH